MALIVEFMDGPAAGTTRVYARFERALPSLYWRDDADPVLDAVYHLASTAADPATGHWPYVLAHQG